MNIKDPFHWDIDQTDVSSSHSAVRIMWFLGLRILILESSPLNKLQHSIQSIYAHSTLWLHIALGHCNIWDLAWQITYNYNERRFAHPFAVQTSPFFQKYGCLQPSNLPLSSWDYRPADHKPICHSIFIILKIIRRKWFLVSLFSLLHSWQWKDNCTVWREKNFEVFRKINKPQNTSWKFNPTSTVL